MNSQEFEVLVRSLESKAKRHPRRFVWVTGLLAVIGFAYLLLVFLFSLASTLGIVALVIAFPNWLTIKLGLVFGVLLGGLAFAILRALWVRLSPPDGVRLTVDNAPQLMRLVDDLRRRIGSARFHRVVLNGDYNASVVQVPRLGLFGWHSNHLVLGLPLMQSMAPKEFEAVLAHEFAHLAGGHGRFGNWLYRLRRSWERLFEQLARQQTGGARLLTGFLGWFWPRFNGHAFVLSRAHEYEADALAARVSGAENIASALKRIAVYARHLDESFWKDVYLRARHVAEPPADIFTELPVRLRAGPERGDAEKWMRQAYLINTTMEDTHPCLRERLSALSQLPEEGLRGEMPVLVGATAADELLGPHQSVLAASLGQEWADRARAAWAARHEETKSYAAVLEASRDQSIPSAETTVAALWKRADAVAGLEGSEAAQPLIAQILGQEPEHPGALFARGAHRLQQDDPSGIPDLERAMQLDETWAGPGLELLAGYHHRHGHADELRQLGTRWEQHAARTQAAEEERAVVLLNDVLGPPVLSEKEKENFLATVSAEPAVAAAWCVKKETRHLPHVPMHLITVKVSLPWWRFQSDSATQKMVGRLASGLNLNGTFLVFVWEKNLKNHAERLSRVPGALMYTRAERA